MRGHEPILAMRRSGVRPAGVTLSDADEANGLHWWQWRDLLASPWVYVQPGDVPELLDLRFCVGLPVTVHLGPDVARMRRLVLAAEAAGASRVLGWCGRVIPGKFDAETLDMVGTNFEDQSWRT